MSESQRLMRWRLVFKAYGHNIKHISVVDNLVSDKIISMPSAPKY